MLATPSISRLVALLLLAAVLLAGLLWVIEPLRTSFAEADQAVADAREQLARYGGIAVQKPDLERRVAALGQDQSLSASYLSGETDALAAASLQSRVATLIASSGAALGSIQVLPARDEEGLRRVGIRLQFTARIEGLTTVLQQTESGVPALFIDNLDIQSRMLPATAASSDPTVEPVLTVALDVYGFLRAEALTGATP